MFERPHSRRNRAITIVELVIYGGLIFGVCFGVYEAINFFQEWQCRKNMAALNEGIEIQQTASAKLKELEDIKPGLSKSSIKTIPKCPAMPTRYNYFFVPAENRVRCAYHGTL